MGCWLVGWLVGWVGLGLVDWLVNWLLVGWGVDGWVRGLFMGGGWVRYV